MAKKRNKSNSEETNKDEQPVNEETPIVNTSSEDDNQENNSENQETSANMGGQKTKDELYNEICKAEPIELYKAKFAENKKAMEGTEGAKLRQVTLVGNNKSVPFAEIEANKPYAIKKYSLYFMFKLTEEQRTFLAETPLNWFAHKRIFG